MKLTDSDQVWWSPHSSHITKAELAAILHRRDTVVNLTSGMALAMAMAIASCIAPAQGTNRCAAATAVNPELNSFFSSRCLL